jgi:hypothetical protein
MRDMKKLFSTFAAIGIMQAGAWAQSKFNVYGFMDATVSKLTLEDKSQLYEFAQADLMYGLGRVNTYLDWLPNANTRVLIETQYLGSSFLPTSGVDRRIRTIASIPGVGVVKDTTVNLPPTQGESRFTGFNLERAWGEVRFNQYLNLRVGKFITPAGIWNVDHASPVILTVKQPYQTTTLPIFPVSQVGTMALGKVFLGDHDLEYSLYLSTGSQIDNDLENAGDLAGGGHVDLRLDLPVKAKIGVSGYSGMKRTARLSATATMNRNAMDLASPTADPALRVPHPDEYKYERVANTEIRENAMGVDYRLDFMNVLLQGEVNGKSAFNELKGDAETKYLAWYVIAGYQYQILPNLKLTPYVMYEGIGWEDAGNAAPGLDVLAASGWDTYLAGLNLQLFSNVFVKLEYSNVAMRPESVSALSPGSPIQVPNDFSQSDLTMNSFATQISFAF